MASFDQLRQLERSAEAGRFAAALTVASLDGAGSGAWQRYRRGVVRRTGFGSEAIVVDSTRSEDFLTVSHHRGSHTWRWRLGFVNLHPRSRVDGSIDLLGSGARVPPRIMPVRITDGRGRDVTPATARWRLDRTRRG